MLFLIRSVNINLLKFNSIKIEVELRNSLALLGCERYCEKHLMLEWLFHTCILSSYHIIEYLFEKIRKLIHLYFIYFAIYAPIFFVTSDVPFILTMFVFSFLFFLVISWFLPLCYPSVTYSFFFEPISGNTMLLPASLILWQNNYLHSSLVLLGDSSCDVCTSCAFVHRFPLLLRKKNCQSLSTAFLLISFIFLFIFEWW